MEPRDENFQIEGEKKIKTLLFPTETQKYKLQPANHQGSRSKPLPSNHAGPSKPLPASDASEARHPALANTPP